MERFKGRVIVAGRAGGRALVSRGGLDLYAAYSGGRPLWRGAAPCRDRLAEIYGRNMAGAALCISRGSGISEGGTALFSALYRGGGPACILLAEPAGPSVVSGAVLARVWLGRAVPTIDRLGAEFLYAVRDGGAVSVFEDGTVIVA